MNLIRNLGKFSPQSSALFLCDINRVLAAAQLMSVPTVATEQYPKGLGNTVPELEIEKYGIIPHAKTCFTMILPKLLDELKAAQTNTKSVILCGIETHACIHHTTLDLLELGLDVHIPVDCVSSRSMTDRKFGLERLRQVGAFLTTSEAVILGLAPDASHRNFKGLQKLVMTSAMDTGLL